MGSAVAGGYLKRLLTYDVEEASLCSAGFRNRQRCPRKGPGTFLDCFVVPSARLIERIEDIYSVLLYRQLASSIPVTLGICLV